MRSLLASVGALALVLILAGCTHSHQAAPSPLQAQDFNDALAEALEERPLVAVGENHGHVDLYELLKSALREPRIVQAVDDIVVEFATSRHQDLLDQFIAGEPVAPQELPSIWRDTASSLNRVWESPVYEEFLYAVRDINRSLPPEDRYRVLAGDPPVDWQNARSREDLLPWPDRPRHFADTVISQVLQEGRRALLLAGGAHMSQALMIRTTKQGLRRAEVTPVAYIELAYPGSVYVIRSLGSPRGFDPSRLAEFPTPSVLPVRNTWLGALPANDLTSMRNRDGSPFTLYQDARLQDMADAVLFWGSAEDARFAPPPPLESLDAAYREELQRRRGLFSR